MFEASALRMPNGNCCCLDGDVGTARQVVRRDTGVLGPGAQGLTTEGPRAWRSDSSLPGLGAPRPRLQGTPGQRLEAKNRSEVQSRPAGPPAQFPWEPLAPADAIREASRLCFVICPARLLSCHSAQRSPPGVRWHGLPHLPLALGFRGTGVVWREHTHFYSKCS